MTQSGCRVLSDCEFCADHGPHTARLTDVDYAIVTCRACGETYGAEPGSGRVERYLGVPWPTYRPGQP